MEWFRPEDRREYEITRKRADQVKKKKGVWEKMRKYTKPDHAGRMKLLYSMTKNYRSSHSEQAYSIKDENGQLLVHPDDIANR